jgi:ArsR family metal-binding transcriptional regulator
VGGFENRTQAVLFFDELSAYINAISDKKASLTPNHKRHKPVPVMEIFKLLPRSNCRKCGLPTCLAYAAALRKGEIPMEKCPWMCDPKSENVMKINALFG